MRKKIVTTFITAAMVTGLLAGCGSSTQPAATAQTQAKDTAAATQAQDTSAAADASTAGQESTGAGDLSSVWPDGTTVYFDVPAKAGGGTDLFSRYLTQALQETYPNINFVVTNYDTEEVGMQHAKNAKADGTTLLTCHGGAVIKNLTGASGVSIKDDMRAIALLNQGSPQAIIGNPGAPYTNFTELADYIKAHPGELTVGCSLGGTTQILFTSFMNALVGDTSLVNFVQCSSEADKLTNVASNAINIANCSIPNAQDYDADGKLTILGTLGPKASTLESMSELLGSELDAKFASTVEQGIETTWDSNYYVLAPAGVPDDVAAAINEAIMAAEKQQSYIDGMNKMAAFAEPTDLAGSQDALNTEWDNLDTLVSSMGLKK